MAEPPNYVPWDEETVAAAKRNVENRRHEEISRIAYFKWQAAGSPHGDGSKFWLAAEKEYNKLNNPTACFQPKTKKEKPKEATKPTPLIKVTEKEIRPPMPFPEIRDDENLPWMERIRRFWARLINP